MSDAVIQIKGLGKKYVISHLRARRYTMLRDKLTDGARASAKRLWQSFSKTSETPKYEEFWALKDVSMEVNRGEIIGIIGRNGAGKSTLLKILSRITEPTTGRIEIEGRVASLLEVGTGFHRELSGRENIYLNGAILGMTRAEINRKFDEIVAFAEVEKFLDTPVKRYSSGMQVRLAFAVAAHLEPDILIVDEVLAVGDAAFQKKCLGKMGDVSSQEGRTVLFVSHNMETLQALCQRSYLLESGKLIGQGPTKNVVDQYLQSVQVLMLSESTSLEQRKDRSGDGSARIISCQITSADDDEVIRSTSRLKVTIGYRSEKPILHPQFSAIIYDYHSNIGLISLDSDIVGGIPDVLPPEGQVTCVTEPLFLTPGRGYINLSLIRAGGAITADHIQYAAYFDLEGSNIFGSGKIPERDLVVCLRQHAWTVED
ncbi:MAG: ABC transporter ATP-binding protein [Verrucomicrobia bacterium]|nr:ABC transporter ATP-binding protein [Verrucomicrobiota bacterium]